MPSRRTAAWIAPPVLVALAMAWSSALAAAVPSRDPVAVIGWGEPAALARCAPADVGGPALPARPLPPAGREGLVDATAWRLAPALAGDGTLTGWRLTVGQAGARAATMDLPAAATVSGPTDGRLLVASDDGRRSTLSAAGGCATELLQWPEVIRQAAILPGSGDVVFHAVRRLDRSDLGVWRLGRGGGAPRRILAPLEQDDPILEAVGKVWTTTLRPDAAGTLLAVQSCGETACRTRVLDLAAGDVRRVGAGEDGAMVGLGDGWLVAFSGCHGLPCPLTATSVADGRQRVLAAAAWSATTVVRDGRWLVLAVARDHDGPQQHLIDPADGRVARLGAADPTIALLPAGGSAGAGLEAGGGRVPAVRLSDGTPVAIDLDRLVAARGTVR